MPETPELKQFRIERPGNEVLHLVFDMPGRSMNVFSNAAIEELRARFARGEIDLSEFQARMDTLTRDA